MTQIHTTIKTSKHGISYQPLTVDDFLPLIRLANEIHGDGYLDFKSLTSWYQNGLSHNHNASFVAYHHDKLVGFRITFAHNHWQIDQWVSPNLWQVDINKVCYFKCNTIDESYRSLGIGRKLLELSITVAKRQGAVAGVSHLWKQSPNNSAISYFTKCGGKLVKLHPNKWHEDSKNGYDCILCGLDCHCEAAEMIIYFA